MYLDVVDLNGVLTWRQQQRAGLPSVETMVPCVALDGAYYILNDFHFQQAACFCTARVMSSFDSSAMVCRWIYESVVMSQ